jgi:hypothetical protein
MDWKKTRSKALGLGSTLLELHASKSGALNAAANVGLFNYESQLMLRPRQAALESEPADRPANDNS